MAAAEGRELGTALAAEDLCERDARLSILPELVGRRCDSLDVTSHKAEFSDWVLDCPKARYFGIGPDLGKATRTRFTFEHTFIVS